jgi:hypothetical protein
MAAILPCIIGPRYDSPVVLMEFLDSVQYECDKDKFCEINYEVAFLLSIVIYVIISLNVVSLIFL